MPRLSGSSSFIRSLRKGSAKCSSRFQKERSSCGARKNRKTWAPGLSSNRDCERFSAPRSPTPGAKPVPAPLSARSLATSASKRVSLRTRSQFELIALLTAPESYLSPRCFAGCRMLASPARHEPELQRYIEPAAHGFSDEGEPCQARAGNAQELGGEGPLPGDSKIARGTRISRST